jgi:DNA-binding NarL/FixJ family response regulator
VETSEDVLVLPPIAVLLVDDQRRAAQQLATLLQQWGAVEAQVVTTLNDAMGCLREPRPRLVLLDQRLTGWTGDELALWIGCTVAVRERTQVLAYSQLARSAIDAALRSRCQHLAHDEVAADACRQQLAPDDHARLAALIQQGGDATAPSLFDVLYDGYLAKRAPLHALAAALVPLAQRLSHTT